VIKIESAHIEEVRGIRKLDLDFKKGNFAISGRNGSGKSGVIDALEFGLTGRISRLTGKGTKNLTIADHGPHVDKVKFPDAAFVELRVHLTDIDKSATITRKMSTPKKPKITPADPDVIAAFQEIADHPEIALSRREILRFIIVEPRQRSEEIQAILKLDEIGETRGAFNTAQNKLQTAQRNAAGIVSSSRDALVRHLQISALRANDLLTAVNTRLKLLRLPEISDLTSDTKLDTGLAGATIHPEFNKQSVLRDLQALSDAHQELPDLAKPQVAEVLAALAQLEMDPALLSALQERTFIEKGLDLVQGPECPLCDCPWDDEESLRAHLREKLVKSDEARKVQDSLLKNGTTIAQQSTRVSTMLDTLQKIAETEGETAFARLLGEWRVDLEALKTSLTTVDGLTGLKVRLVAGWMEIPKGFAKSLQKLREKVAAKPDQTTVVDAQTFLTTAQLRLDDYREAMRKNKAAEAASTAGKAAYETYCSVLEEELNSLYDEVQKDFSTFYRAVNGDDEADFTAKLTPNEGSLGLDVNFYDRGLFPPAAFHSEGHQDGMGVCLYLALMKRLFGTRFSFALLDDVVMSVDSGHRYQFCKLLKTHFPNTQFIITTHDRLWAEQMKSAGLVTGKTSISFHSWTIDTGPLVESNDEIWTEIRAALGRGKVEVAAAALRHHLEYASRHLADQLGATPQFRADGNYELGDLLPSVLKRMKDLCGKAAAAAQSWGKTAEHAAASSRRTTLSESNGAINVEQWAVNKAVHYNEWANFGKKDFEPVVTAFKELLNCFSCPDCNSWIHATPRVNPESVRCMCAAINLNLKAKEK
jgi:recombinational DNA repair ATPase RecF